MCNRFVGTKLGIIIVGISTGWTEGCDEGTVVGDELGLRRGYWFLVHDNSLVSNQCTVLPQFYSPLVVGLFALLHQ